jgi:hypothetical protein
MKISDHFPMEKGIIKGCANPEAVAGPMSHVEAMALAIVPETPADNVLEIYDRIKFYKSELNRIHGVCEQQMIEWIKANGDLQVREGVRYYVGREKRTKCVNLPAAVEALLASAEGDFARFCEGLSSGAVKYGHAAKVLPAEVYEQCFTTEYVEDMKEGGAKKKLLKADEQFIKPAARPAD